MPKAAKCIYCETPIEADEELCDYCKEEGRIDPAQADALVDEWRDHGPPGGKKGE